MVMDFISKKNEKGKSRGIFRKEKTRDDTVAYLINLCAGIMEEYDMAIGATINRQGIPVPMVIDMKENKIYQMNTPLMGPAKPTE